MKKTIKTFGVLFAFAFAASFAFAQEGPGEKIAPDYMPPPPSAAPAESAKLDSTFDFRNALGAFVTTSNDIFGGLEYQRWFAKTGDALGIETQLGLYWNNSSSSNDINVDVNCQLDWRLAKFEIKNFASILYAYGNLGFSADYDYRQAYVSGESASISYKAGILAGGGFGFDLLFFRHLSIPIQVGYMAYIGLGSYNTSDPFWCSFAYTTGIRYRF